MADFFQVKVKKNPKSKSKHPIERIHEIVSDNLFYYVEKYCRKKVNRWPLEFLSECRLDEPIFLEDGFLIDLKDAGGMCGASSHAAVHWFTVMYQLIYKDLNEKIKNYGYSLEPITIDPELKAYPMIDVRGVMYYYVRDAEGLHLYGDDRTLEWDDLSKSIQKRLEEKTKDNLCHCSLCVDLRKGKSLTFYI